MQCKVLMEVDYARWDEYVKSHSLSSPYHLTAWKRAVEIAYGHQTHYLMAIENNNIVGILPIVSVKTPLLVHELCSLPFCDLGGILAESNTVYEFLLQSALDLVKQLKADKLSLRQTQSSTVSEQEAEALSPGTKVRMILALPESSQALLEGFKSKLRSQVRKSEKNGVSYALRDDIEAKAAFYKVMQINMRQLGSPVHSRKWFESVMNAYQSDAKLFVAIFDNKIVGGSILLLCNEVATVPWASTLPEYNRLAPNMALYWAMLEYAADHRFKRFDFGRSSIGEGTYNFKKQWGARPVPLDWQVFNNQGSKVEQSAGPSNIRERVAKIWSGLPAPVTNAAGPMLRKYISL